MALQVTPQSSTAGSCGSHSLVFLRHLHVVSIVAVMLPTPSPVVNEDSSFSTPSPPFGVMYFLDVSHTDWDEWNLKALLICISPLVKDIEDFLIAKSK